MRWHHERRCRRRGLPCCARHEHRSGLLSHAQARTHTCAAQSRTVKPSRCGLTKNMTRRRGVHGDTGRTLRPRRMHCPERCTLPPPAQCVQCWSVKQASGEAAVLEWAAEVIGRKVFVPWLTERRLFTPRCRVSIIGSTSTAEAVRVAMTAGSSPHN